jgi:hypothetical protein
VPVAGPVAPSADDAELELVLSGCVLPPNAAAELRLLAEVAPDPGGRTAEVAAAITGTHAWTLHASGAGGAPEVRVAAPGRVAGPVLVLGALPGDVDRDGARTVVDVRRQVVLAGTEDRAADADGDGLLTPFDLGATRGAVLGRTTVLPVPPLLARATWIAVRGVFPELRGVQATLGARVLPLGCATPRELTLFVPDDQPAGPQQLVVSVAGRVVASAAVEVQ